ncbi:MAG: hypothetical protein ACRDFX_00835 [Chloroflexota bacterium]
MRTRSNRVVLFLSIAPIVVLVYLMYVYKTSGSWPLSMPSWSIPVSLSVPSFMQPYLTIPQPVQHLAARAGRNWVTIVLGAGGGLLGGILLAGILHDVFVSAVKWLRPPSPEPAPLLTEETTSTYFSAE